MKELLYVTDPMCPWCWAFTDTMKAVREQFADSFRFVIVLGGLRVGEDAFTVTDEQRVRITGMWQKIAASTGCEFGECFPESGSFRYDSEPSCLAVAAVRKLKEDAALDYFSAVQKSFYLDGEDISSMTFLAGLAEQFGVDKDAFMQAVADKEVVAAMRHDFRYQDDIGAEYFPSLFIRDGAEVTNIVPTFWPKEKVLDVVGKSAGK